ncbi:CP2 transcription factor family protein-like protein [Lentithecium fluviatile CBS 122367]|uniref:CP2 transcription factor family protein-like protein n=1 Tax=Lentithecium fluviatile CBS 122367 TaxID=1168545 RepID=A0A6G1J5P2_9PLEO|nr:CP2 transcription factor family protein-like protein [Lentithecium fluviatile CBS 122367]
MFRNRTNSQKPNEELLENFRASFPHLAQTTRSQSLNNPTGSSLTDALDVAHTARNFGDHEDIKDTDPTPRGNNEPWRFTPSLLDPNSFAFSSFANQPPGYYTPTPGGTNTLYHNQAGDLHTPGFSFGLGTPLSLPTSESALHAGQTAPTHLHGFNPHALGHHQFTNQNPFALQQQAQHAPSFAPHQFTHQPSAYERHPPLAQTHEGSPMDNVVPEVEMQEQSPLVGFAHQSFGETVPQQQLAQPPGENFRYHVTLNAPTAMIKHSDEIPVTYLNKGQAYTISLVDTAPIQTSSVPMKYRTFIRISFEDEQQRQRPAACWQLWKEGRGTNEAHQRGGRLQAVEFVDPSQVGGGEVQGRPKVELEHASFDGFAVTWTPVHNAAPECSVAVRFNFLSTDFSHSKGVKGIPVRLCAKTELLTGTAGSTEESTAELCYCKVKLFRDHGAERKLSNDVAHVKKTIDKLKQQIAQVESGMKDFGKRKRSGSISKSSASSRPGKVPKHKRTWSMSSASSNSGTRAPAEEDLHTKLANLQDMFSSTRPVSVLYLKGGEADDPDLNPVQLAGTPQDLAKIDTNVDATMWERQSSHTGATSSIVSPTPSSQSLHSERRRGSTFQQPAPFPPPSRMSSNDWRNLPQTATGDLKPVGGMTAGSDVPTKVHRPYGDDHALSGWIEALGVDQTYQPPPEPMLKPVACFFVQPRIAGKQPDDNYFRAVYLMERTVKALVSGIAMKLQIEPTKVSRTIRINQKGLQILLDDDAVQAIPEQQDMTAEFHEIIPPLPPPKREWDAGPTDIQVDGEIGVVENVHSTGYELRLLY